MCCLIWEKDIYQVLIKNYLFDTASDWHKIQWFGHSFPQLKFQPTRSFWCCIECKFFSKAIKLLNIYICCIFSKYTLQWWISGVSNRRTYYSNSMIWSLEFPLFLPTKVHTILGNHLPPWLLSENISAQKCL